MILHSSQIILDCWKTAETYSCLLQEKEGNCNILKRKPANHLEHGISLFLMLSLFSVDLLYLILFPNNFGFLVVQNLPHILLTYHINVT